MRELEELIEDRSAVVGVVGLGYAGLPVAVAFAEAGFRVRGVDIDEARVAQIERGRSYLNEVSHETVARLRGSDTLRAFSRYEPLSEVDAVLICVPTPLRDHQPDLSAVESAGTEVARVLRRGGLVLLESTSYPGTTEEVLLPLLAQGGRTIGEDFHLAFSPERIDPGNQSYSFREIPKVVGGVTPRCGELAARLYGAVVDKVVVVSGPKEAELAKLLENTFRNVNIALVNELSVYAHDLGIDIWEAIDAAASKPFGFMPFYPGPGVGGHCIGIDPSYLSWRVKQTQGHAFRFVELADELNRVMPKFVVGRITELLNERGKALRGANVLVIGAAYKPGIEDVRESPSVHLIELLRSRKAAVDYHDPLVSQLRVGEETLESVPLDAARLRGCDLVVVVTPQPGIDYRLIQKEAALVFDTRNAMRSFPGPNVVTL